MSNVNSVYIHIPFCKNICTYCDFCKLLYNEEFISKYLVALKNEINDKYMGEVIKTLYIGGGTPSSLSPKLLNNLFSIVKLIKLDSNYEFTFECNIYDINEELLKILKDNKVNRLSIGIESFNHDNLELMDRVCTYDDTEKKLKLCRKYGFNNINLDLIYALPYESFKTLKNDVKQLIKLNPEHISTYSLELKPNTLLSLKGYTTIDEELDYKMYKYIIHKLTHNGYNHYEVSNFSKKGYESQHNLNCWHNQEYYGFGLSASGYYEGVRYTNTLNFTKYLNNDLGSSKEIVSLEDKKYYELILGLRLMQGLNLKDYQNTYDEDLLLNPKINSLLKSKELINKHGNIYINPKKIYIMDSILIKLV